jgi:organic radical activating enzyme
MNQAKSRGFTNCRLTLSGGEPTVHPHFLKVIERYGDFKNEDNVLNLIIVTNLSRSYNWFQQFAHACRNLNNVSIVASWHREYGIIDEFIEKCLFLMSKNINVAVNVTFAVDHFQGYYQESLYMKSKGLVVKALPQRFTNTREYTKEELDILQNDFKYDTAADVFVNEYPSDYVTKDKINDKHCTMELVDMRGKKHYVDYAERFPSLGFQNFEGWKCYAGFQNLCIDEFGDLRRGKSGCKDYVIGNIFTGPYGFDEPVECPVSLCDAATDSVTRKVKSELTIDKNSVVTFDQLTHVDKITCSSISEDLVKHLILSKNHQIEIIYHTTIDSFVEPSVELFGTFPNFKIFFNEVWKPDFDLERLLTLLKSSNSVCSFTVTDESIFSFPQLVQFHVENDIDFNCVFSEISSDPEIVLELLMYGVRISSGSKVESKVKEFLESIKRELKL